MKKDNFNEWYKNSFEQLREEPPADVWDNIQSELDVEEVWTRVDKQLILSDRYSTFRKWSYGIAAALLLTAGGIWMHNDLSSQLPVAQKAERHGLVPASVRTTMGIEEPGSQASTAAAHATIHLPGKPFVKEKKRTSPGVYASSASHGDSSSGSSMTVDIAPGMDEALVASTGHFVHHLPVPALPTMLLAEDHKENTLASAFDPSLSPDSIIAAKIPRGFSIGPVVSCNNTWIMNSTTYAGLKSKGLYHSRMSLAGAYGLSASYDLNSFWGMEATVTDLTQRQVYSYFNRAGEYKEKANTLEYIQLAFLIKKRKPVITGSRFKGITRTLAIGPALRSLHSATDETNGSSKGAAYQYAKNDYGVVLAYGYDIPVKNNIMLSPGITAYGGAKDISRGREVEPSHFNRTHNLSIGAHFTARYIFGQR